MTDQAATSAQDKAVITSIKEIVKELRRQRRWKNIFRVFIVFYLLILLIPVMSGGDKEIGKISRSKPHVALVDIHGVISSGSQSNADDIVGALRHAFDNKKAKGIILRINSPGGSPVQADYIYREIVRLRKKHKDMKIYAVCVDACASAAYYIAAAADDIYANNASLVGSIGVLMDGFGFVDTMKKVGATRRLITAGKYKGFLDPFSPMNDFMETHAKQMLADIHQLFINRVKAGRGKRLKKNDNLFTGLVWTGDEAKALGLVDDIGSAGSIARDVFKTDNVVNYTHKPSYFERLANRFGSAMYKQMSNAMRLDGQTPRIR